MNSCYLEVTYRKGRPFTAYYYLPRQRDDHSVRTEQIPGGILVDFAPDGRAIGIEITSPSGLDLVRLNKSLVDLGVTPVQAEELAPILAA
jgi:hypothetical protein